MVKPEIIIGLQNGLSRQEPLEKAMQSMLNAGYSQQDVQEAAQNIHLGTIEIAREVPVAAGILSSVSSPASQESNTKKSSWKKITLLSGVFIVLLGVMIFVFLKAFK
jgi:hypothetical protein